jgi:AcrR family transcriptional regulator
LLLYLLAERTTMPDMPGRNDIDETILVAAERLFAEHGFDTPLERIARAARVSPAVVRRRIGGKRALVDRVIERLFRGRWKPEWDTLLADRSKPLEERLVRFYVDYRNNISRTGARLWTRTGLMGLHGSRNISATLATRILKPIVRELRYAAGIARPDRRTVTTREIELVQVVHGAIAFPHTRSHIFDMDVHGTLEVLVPMIVRVWLPGALAEIKRLNRR